MVKLTLRDTFLISSLLLWLFAAASIHVDEVHVNRRELIQEQQRQEYISRNISPLKARSLADWHLENIILVSDIDGNLHGVDRSSGMSIWTLPIDDPLVRVHREKVGEESSEHSNVVWIVEPANDGYLYYFSPEFGLNKLPTTIKNLVMESPFSLSGDNKIYTGSRKTSLYSIEVRTGQIVNQFGLLEDENCPVPNVYRTPNRDSSKTRDDTIMLGKSTYELSIHSKLDSSVVWNLTFSQWGPNNIDTDLILQNGQLRDNLYFTPFYDKSLLAINKALGTPSWIGRLPSLAVDVFDVFSKENDELVALPHPLNLLNELQATEFEKNNNLCFINKTVNGNEWFAMSYKNYPALVKLAPLSPYQLILEKYDHGYFDQEDIDQLKNLSVEEELAAAFLNGVHEIFELDPKNLYQPTAKFNPTKRIGTPNEYKAEVATQIVDSKQVPSLISGIFFPDNDDKIVATVEKHDYKQLNSNPASFHTNLPIKYYEPYSAFEDTYRHEPVSLFRRVAEDLLVMSILLGALLGFRKVSQWIKNRNSRQFKHEKSALPVIEPEISVSDKSEKPLPLVPEPVENGKLDESESVTLVGEEVKPTKRVTIVSPDEAAKDLSTAKDNSIEKDDSAEKDDPESDTLGQSDDEGDALLPATKKKRKRGSRGGKRSSKSRKNKDDGDEATVDEDNENDDELIITLSLVKLPAKPTNQRKKLQINNNLIISDKILGYGSHGTVVFEGTFENRPVAVKRMLDNFYHLADHEVRLLQESDDHPNVIRYFCSQLSETENFLYIALELCVCSLEEIVEKLESYPTTLRLCHKKYNEVLLQLVKGLHYLHSLKIVHRDLKPQNILVTETARRNKQTDDSSIRLLISDFGLCKKLDADQSSFRATTNHAASGTMGWRAPELLLLHDLNEISLLNFSSNHSKQTSSIGGEPSESSTGQGKRLTKAIDIFSLGCVFFYILSGGGHPFGDRYLREGNIISGKFDLSPIDRFCPDDNVEATDLIRLMISFNPSLRPDTTSIMKHPYFWTTKKKLEFLLKVSDRFEIERRDPPSPLLLKLEEIGPKIHGGDWLAKFDDDFINNLGKYRKYSTAKLMDLMRAFRNKYHHFNDMPSDLQIQMSPVPNGFYQYFNRKFPNLLMEVHSMIRRTLHEEHVFEEFL